jgi:hypothetical protein
LRLSQEVAEVVVDCRNISIYIHASESQDDQVAHDVTDPCADVDFFQRRHMLRKGCTYHLVVPHYNV